MYSAPLLLLTQISLCLVIFCFAKSKIFTGKSPLALTNLPCLPDGDINSNDGRNGNNQSEFPVPLQCPENYSVSLEQEERIESLQILEGKYGIYGDEESLERDLPRV